MRGSDKPLRIYVEVDDDAALLEAGITAPDVETHAEPGGPIEETEETVEEVVRGVELTIRKIPAAIRDRVETKVMAVLMLAGFDPHLVTEDET